MPLRTENPQPLTVTRFGSNDASFHVTSELQPLWTYVVDLADPEYPYGHCTCEDFFFRVASQLRQERKPRRWACKHILCALAYMDQQDELTALMDSGMAWLYKNYRSRSFDSMMKQ